MAVATAAAAIVGGPPASSLLPHAGCDRPGRCSEPVQRLRSTSAAVALEPASSSRRPAPDAWRRLARTSLTALGSGRASVPFAAPQGRHSRPHRPDSDWSVHPLPPARRQHRLRRRLALMLGVSLFSCLSWEPGDSAHAAGFVSLFGTTAEEKDPVEPFTLYGSIVKKYLIEVIEDGKIVGRKKGFTASTCVNALEASKHTPAINGTPPGLLVSSFGDPSCAKGVGRSREESCMAPCNSACMKAIQRHLAHIKDTTGYLLDEKDRSKVLKSCSSQCFYECTKPGNSISFVVPFRP